MITGDELWDLLCRADDGRRLLPYGTFDELHGQWHILLNRATVALNAMALEDVQPKGADLCATLNCGHSLSREHKTLVSGGYGLCLMATCACEKGRSSPDAAQR